MQKRIDDFRGFRVPNIWVRGSQGPHRLGLLDNSWIRQQRFEVSETSIYLSLHELFAQN